MWLPIEDFPGYSVSEEGQVRNDRTGRILALTRNQFGIIQVGLSRFNVQYKRSVALLVAKAHLDPPHLKPFNTPIHLDGDRSNNHYSNLMWRPRWFAVKYHAQFQNDERGFDVPVIELHSGERFRSSWDAAIKYGLIDRDIRIATVNRTYVFPTYQEFRVIE
jgi:hypothetical protein